MTLINMAEGIRGGLSSDNTSLVTDEAAPGVLSVSLGTVHVDGATASESAQTMTEHDPVYLNFNEIIAQLQELLAAGHEVASRVIEDFYQFAWDEVHGANFTMPETTARRLLWAVVVDPEGYGHTWGWTEAPANEVDWEGAVGDFIQSRAPTIAERLLRTEMTVGELRQLIVDQRGLAEEHGDRVITEKQLRGLERMNFLDLLETFDVDMPVQELFERMQEGDGQMYQYGNGNQIPRGFVIGNTGGLVTVWVGNRVDEETARIAEQLENAFYEEELNPHNYDEELTVDGRVILDDEDMETFRSQIPNPVDRKRGYRLVLPGDAELVPGIIRRMHVEEGRYLGETHIGREFFEQFRRSSHPRYLPRNGRVPARALTAEEAATTPRLDEDYTMITPDIFDLFYTPTNQEIAELNRRIDHCLQTGEPLVLYIPTCPCDQHAYVEAEEAVAFIGGPILPGISWPAMNTLDAMQPLVDRLNALGVDVEVVFATGDIEHPSGQTRGMGADDYFAVLDENHASIAAHAACRLDVAQGVIMTEERASGYHIRQFTRQNGRRTTVRVEGIMQIAGDEDQWMTRRRQVEPIVDAYFDHQGNQAEMDRVMTARANIYRQRVAAAQGLAPEDIPPLSREVLLAELRTDIIDYCAFHGLAADMYGNERMIVLAGDSRPLESLAARIMGTHLLPVHGNYDGSRFNDE